jgi:cell division GTPase FtsZ
MGRQRAQGHEFVEAEICVIGVGTAGNAAVRSAIKEPITGVRLPSNPDLVLIAADMGKGVVTDARPEVAPLSKETGAQVVAFAAFPHRSEGRESRACVRLMILPGMAVMAPH